MSYVVLKANVSFVLFAAFQTRDEREGAHLARKRVGSTVLEIDFETADRATVEELGSDQCSWWNVVCSHVE